MKKSDSGQPPVREKPGAKGKYERWLTEDGLLLLADGGNYTVYEHVFPNGKKYIGITMQRIQNRWRNGKGYKVNDHLKNAISKHGWESVRHNIVSAGLSKSAAELKEKELIAAHKTNDKRYGYNIQEGGQACDVLSKETREKIRNALKGKCTGADNPFYGRRHTEETKKILSEIRLGTHQTADLIKKRANARKVKVTQLGIDGKLIKVWDSAKDAGDALSISKTVITACCKKQKHRNTAGRYKWEYTNG
ncbi:MAG: NUMOD3 domain-containing DNA-binding protein [Candidatus Micrarchaeia archaeon]|jgi:group I intron endonuclease